MPRTPSKRHMGLLCYVAKANKTQQGPILAPSGSINWPLGAVGGHVSPNCVLFNLALQTAKLLLPWLESPISHLGTYLFSWIGN